MQLSSLILSALAALPLVHSAALPTALQPRQAGTVYTQCNKPGVIALTFDDGPGQYQGQLLDVLKNAGAVATFFVTGTLYGCIFNRQDSLKRAYNEGHQIASHTWSHANMASYSASQIQNEMTKLEVALANILGIKPQYMRPPNLSVGGSMTSTLGQMGYRIINCDIDSGDWNNVSPQASLQKFQQAGAGGNGHIPLMHETVASTPSQLAGLVINWAKQNNLKFVTVAECTGAGAAYVPATTTGSRNC